MWTRRSATSRFHGLLFTTAGRWVEMNGRPLASARRPTASIGPGMNRNERAAARKTPDNGREEACCRVQSRRPADGAESQWPKESRTKRPAASESQRMRDGGLPEAAALILGKNRDLFFFLSSLSLTPPALSVQWVISERTDRREGGTPSGRPNRPPPPFGPFGTQKAAGQRGGRMLIQFSHFPPVRLLDAAFRSAEWLFGS